MPFSVEIAYSIKYGKHKTYRQDVEALKGLIEHNEPLIRSMLDLPHFVHIRFKPLPKRCYGRFNSFTKIVDVSPAQNPYDAMKAILHELVHLEQYNTGKLQRGMSKTKRQYIYYWLGREVEYPDPIANYDKYLNLPWEKEAFGRESKLLEKFIKKARSP